MPCDRVDTIRFFTTHRWGLVLIQPIEWTESAQLNRLAWRPDFDICARAEAD